MKKEKVVYVVDDSLIIVSLITQSINQMKGFIASPFSSAEEMILVAQADQPEVLVLDYFLDTNITDGMNGGEAARYLKEQFPEIKIILISGTSSKKALADIQALNVDVHLLKGDDEILDLINAKILELVG
jgi:CheY-like chemotaxis protein